MRFEGLSPLSDTLVERTYQDHTLAKCGDFPLSIVAGAVFNSAIIGEAIGGDTLGGMIGDLLDGNLAD